jgi:hypothetical protein
MEAMVGHRAILACQASLAGVQKENMVLNSSVIIHQDHFLSVTSSYHYLDLIHYEVLCLLVFKRSRG